MFILGPLLAIVPVVAVIDCGLSADWIIQTQHVHLGRLGKHLLQDLQTLITTGCLKKNED